MVILCMLACGNTNNKQQNTRNNPIVKQEQKKGFQLPEVPIMLNTPEQRAVYVAEHYWDHFDFADTAYIHLPKNSSAFSYALVFLGNNVSLLA